MDTIQLTGICLLIVILIFILIFNSLVSKKNQVSNIFGTIDVMLKKRYDLIPNLVACVKQYMKYEGETLKIITELRSKAVSGRLSDDDKIEINNAITRHLGNLNVTFENYPDLKASQNFIQLQAALNEMEEQIAAARRAYNAAVTEYNNSVEMFPFNMVASMVGYKTKIVLDTPEDERKTVSVKALLNG